MDSIANYKVLQAALDAAGVAKPVDVPRLVQARPADNLAFMQWCKAHFDGVTGGAPLEGRGYDPVARRAASKTGDIKKARVSGGGGSGGARGAGAARTARPSAGQHPPPAWPVAGARPAALKAAAAAPPKPAAPKDAESTTTPSTSAPDAVAVAVAAATEAAAAAAASAARERDFYFSKLRAVELLCSGAPGVAGTPAAALVTRILYAADEAGAVAVLAEAGAPTGREEEGEGGVGAENEAPLLPAVSPPRKAAAAAVAALPPSPLVEGGGTGGAAAAGGVAAAMAGLALSPPAAPRPKR